MIDTGKGDGQSAGLVTAGDEDQGLAGVGGAVQVHRGDGPYFHPQLVGGGLIGVKIVEHYYF